MIQHGHKVFQVTQSPLRKGMQGIEQSGLLLVITAKDKQGGC